MTTTTSTCSAATAVASFDVGYSVVVPPASSLGVAAAVGVEDHKAGVSRLARPCEIEPIIPVGETGWDRFADLVAKMWKAMTVDDLIDLLRLNMTVTTTVSTSPKVVFEAFLDSLFAYFKGEVTSILDTLWKVLTTLAEAGKCQAVFFRATADEFVDLVLKGQFDVSQVLNALQTDCELFRDAVAAVGSLQKQWTELKALGVEGLFDYMGEFAAVLVELLRDAKLQEKAFEMAKDPVKLGNFYGTVYGFILWQILETLLSGPMGKLTKGLKVALR